MVLLKVHVSESGNVEKIDIVKSSNFKLLDEFLVEWVSDWLFILKL